MSRRLRRRNGALETACLIGVVAWATSAGAQGNIGSQGITPQWTFEGRGLVSTPVSVEDDGSRNARWEIVDFADTHLQTRLDSALYDDTIASFALGMRLTDMDSPVGPVYLMRVEAALQTRYFAFQIGRRRRPSIGVTMPTLRDEDLLEFIFPLNPYSQGGPEEDVIFSDVIAATFRWDFRWHAQVFLEALRDTTATGDPGDAAGVEPNSGGVRLFYDQLPSLSRVSIVRHAGVSAFAQRADSKIPELGAPLLWQTKAEGSVNVFPDPIHLVDLRGTLVYQHGATGGAIATVTDSWRARYLSGAISLRYLFAPYQMDRFQAGLSFAFRALTDGPGWASAVVPSVVYRAGGNGDLILQYAFERRSSTLAGVPSTAERSHRVELAFSYSFGVQLFGTVNLPRDLINADYNYVPVN